MKRCNLLGLCLVATVAGPVWGTEPLPANPGEPRILTATPYVGALSEPGWDVTSYKDLAWTASLDDFKSSIALLASTGRFVGHESGVPDIDFVYWGALANNRPVPGFHDSYADDFYGILAKGWIQFPEAGHYSLCLKADDFGEVVIGSEVVVASTAPQWGSEDIDGGTSVDLDVPIAGVYPIQIVWYDVTGADAVEFYRRMGSPDRIVAIGASDGGLADQPLIYQRLNGQLAPDLVSTYSPITPMFAVTIDPGQKCKLPGGGDAVGTGAQALKVKTVLAPWTYYSPVSGYDLYFARDYPREEVWSTVPRRFLEFMGDANGGTVTTETINFNDGGREGLIPDGQLFPGLPAGSDAFAIRAEGFVTFPTAGTYYLTMNADDQSMLRVGNQCVATLYYDHGTIWLVWNVTEAGTYPISIELYEQSAGANLELAELTPSGPVAVNAPGSSITFHESATSGTFTMRPHAFVIPADRKVGSAGDPSGTAGTLGWNVTLAHSTNPFLDAGYSGLVSCLTDNDYWGNPSASDIATDTPEYLDYKDPSDPFPGRFGGTLPWSRFSNCQLDNNDKMCVSAVGYIEFPTAGVYGLNTTTNDSCTMWIAGKIVQSWPLTNSWPAEAVQDNVPVSVYVEEPGIYDIRIDYWDVSGPSMLEMFQYLPDNRDHGAMINAADSTVKVYRTLNTAPTSDLYHNPMRLPLSSKVADIDRGKGLGVRVQVVGFVPSSLDQQPHGGMGHDTFMSLEQADDLLKSVIDGDPVARLYQQGTLLADEPVTPFSVNFPAQSASRMTGYIGLKKGGHVFTMWSDEGFSMTIGGMNFARYSGVHGVGWFMYYVIAPEDGLYPFEVTHENTFDDGVFELREYHPTFEPPYWLALNTDPAVSMVFTSYDTCPIPFADADRDGDVDQMDFGLFQACFTGESSAMPPGQGCSCFDRGGIAGSVDQSDFDEFVNCFSGPAIPTACH